MTDTTTIQLSLITYQRLKNIREAIKKIIHKNIDWDKVVQILLKTKSIDTILMDLIAEIEPKQWKRTTKETEE